MVQASLFDEEGAAREAALAPLAVRMRPQNLDELVGQDRLMVPGSPLKRLIEGDSVLSVILWGPPGTGKTTLALLMSQSVGRRFVEMSALNAGVRDVRAAVETARRVLREEGTQTILFIDEVHRFSRTQQDSLLNAVENRWVGLVAATTENPSFSVVGPLLSRSLLLTLEPLGDPEIRRVVEMALVEERGLGGRYKLGEDVLEYLVTVADGDARRALTALEAGVLASEAVGETTLELELLEAALDRPAVRYDKTGDQHYDVTSAFIKSMRGGDVDATLHYLTRMIAAGEDPRFLARRMVVLASEDIGLADPAALGVAVAAAQALDMVGLPEARYALAQAAIYLAVAPKSDAVAKAISAASADIASERLGPVPAHLRDTHGKGGRIKRAGRYLSPHDSPEGVVAQTYSPSEVDGRIYYDPKLSGSEKRIRERLAWLRRRLKGQL